MFGYLASSYRGSCGYGRSPAPPGSLPLSRPSSPRPHIGAPSALNAGIAAQYLHVTSIRPSTASAVQEYEPCWGPQPARRLQADVVAGERRAGQQLLCARQSPLTQQPPYKSRPHTPCRAEVPVGWRSTDGAETASGRGPAHRTAAAGARAAGPMGVAGAVRGGRLESPLNLLPFHAAADEPWFQ